jgi:selenocysteine lyase/cysteine desulfurase
VRINNELRNLKQWLHKKSVNVSESKWTFINMHRRKLNHFIRASVHYYNTETEIERFCQLIQEYWKEHNSHARGQGEHI